MAVVQKKGAVNAESHTPLDLLKALFAELKKVVGGENIKLVVPQDLATGTFMINVQIEPGEWHFVWFTMRYNNLKDKGGECLEIFTPVMVLNHRFELLAVELIYSVNQDGRTVTLSHPWNYTFVAIVKQSKYRNF